MVTKHHAASLQEQNYLLFGLYVPAVIRVNVSLWTLQWVNHRCSVFKDDGCGSFCLQINLWMHKMRCHCHYHKYIWQYLLYSKECRCTAMFGSKIMCRIFI